MLVVTNTTVDVNTLAFIRGHRFGRQGNDTNALAEENVTTSADAVEFGAPAGVLVTDAETATAKTPLNLFRRVHRKFAFNIDHDAHLTG